MATRVRGSTPEERVESRMRLRRQRRAATYQRELQAATSGMALVRVASRYVMAVADDCPESVQSTIAADLVAMANKWNREA